MPVIRFRMLGVTWDTSGALGCLSYSKRKSIRKDVIEIYQVRNDFEKNVGETLEFLSVHFFDGSHRKGDSQVLNSFLRVQAKSEERDVMFKRWTFPGPLSHVVLFHFSPVSCQIFCRCISRWLRSKFISGTSSSGWVFGLIPFRVVTSVFWSWQQFILP